MWSVLRRIRRSCASGDLQEALAVLEHPDRYPEPVLAEAIFGLIRGAFARVLEQHPGIREVLQRTLWLPDAPLLQVAAAIGLGLAGDTESLLHALEPARTSSSVVRRAICTGLALSRQENIARPMRQLATWMSLRDAIVEVAALIGGPEMQRLLAYGVTGSADSEVAEMAAHALRLVGPDAVPAMRDILAGEPCLSSGTAWEIIQALMGSGESPQLVVPTIVEAVYAYGLPPKVPDAASRVGQFLASHEDLAIPVIRNLIKRTLSTRLSRVVEILAGMATPKAISEIVALLSSSNASIRETTAQALCEHPVRDDRVISHLASMAKGDRSVRVRERAIRALAATGENRVAWLLLDLLRATSSADIRNTIADCLPNVADASVFRAVLQAAVEQQSGAAWAAMRIVRKRSELLAEMPGELMIQFARVIPDWEAAELLKAASKVSPPPAWTAVVALGRP